MNLADGDAKQKEELDYAWNWFQYHASQRLTGFNFFLVLTGFLLVAYGQAVAHDWRPVGIAIGLLGTLVGTGFYALDVRNTEIVTGGSHALERIETSLEVKVATESNKRANLETAVGPRGPSRWLTQRKIGAGFFRHRWWLRCIPAVIGAGFLLGAIWAGSSFTGAEGDSASAQRDGRRVQRCELVVSPSVRAHAQYRILRCADAR